jgi:hypothetical protein
MGVDLNRLSQPSSCMSALRKRAPRKKSKPKRLPCGVNTPGADRAASIGSKHVCSGCGTKFYDMNKPEPTCPRCGADPRAEPIQVPSSAAPKARKRAAPRIDRLLAEEKSSDTEVASGLVDANVELDVGAIDEDELEQIDNSFDADVEEDEEEDPKA